MHLKCPGIYRIVNIIIKSETNIYTVHQSDESGFWEKMGQRRIALNKINRGGLIGNRLQFSSTRKKAQSQVKK